MYLCTNRGALLDKLSSLPLVYMLLDTTVETMGWSIQVVPPGLVLDLAWSGVTTVLRCGEHHTFKNVMETCHLRESMTFYIFIFVRTYNT